MPLSRPRLPSTLLAPTLLSIVSFAMALLAVAAPLRARPAAPADGEAEAIAAVEKQLRNAKEAGEGLVDALDGLGPYDSLAVAELLLKAAQTLEAVAQSTEKLAHAELVKGDLSDGEIIERRAKIDPIRKGQARVLDRLGYLRSTEGLTWLLGRVLGDEAVGISFKLAVVQAAAPVGAALLPVLTKVVPTLKRQDDLVTLLYAVQGLGPAAKALGPALLPLLDHVDATVREQAALALAKVALPEAIEPLVKRLEKESGRTQVKLAAALEILTRQKLGASPNAWKSWFAAEGIRYTSGQAELGGGEPAVQMQATGYFHGIPQDARSIVYVIDCSGSMQVSMTNPQWKDGHAQTQPIPAPPGEESRMEASKKELIRALGELPPTTKFNVVYFSNGADRWQPKLVEASPDRVKKAQKWVADLQPAGATNIYDALENAFAIAGRGAGDKYYDASVDTVYLLTDGQPFLPGGRDPPDRSLQLLRRLNPMKRVTVHAIGLGSGIDAEFLKRVASENGGVFVQR